MARRVIRRELAQLARHRIASRPMAARQASRATAGFTLLELLVALAIAVPTLMLLYREGVLAIGITRVAASYQEAVSRAQSRLDALTDLNLVAGEREGDDGGGFHWHTLIAPVATAAAPRARPLNSPYADGTTLFAVAVQISWGPSSGARVFSLETRRLGPSSASRP